jgi:uncharacterized protein (TIGR00251 family)
MTFRVKVIPRSAKTEIVGTMADGTLKIRIAAPPEKGKANEELIRFLAAHYGVKNVEIISGHTAALKIVRLPDTR